MPTLYEIPLALEKEGLAEIAIRQLHLKCGAPDLTDWVAMVERNRHLGRAVDIALVGKYVELHDSYLSVAEALKHGGIENDAQVRIHWLDSERITPENVEETFQGIDGILVPAALAHVGWMEKSRRQNLRGSRKFRILEFVLACKLRSSSLRATCCVWKGQAVRNSTRTRPIR